MAVADGFSCGNKVGDFIASEEVPESVTRDAVPCRVEGRFGSGAKVLDAVDACGVEAEFHLPANAGDVPKFQFVEAFGEFMGVDHKKTIRFAHFTG